MAMSASPYKEDDVRCFRLSALIVNVGTVAARKLFNDDISTKYSGNLPAALTNLKKKILNGQQKVILFPAPPDVPNSDDFDLTLLVLLFRNLGYPPPTSTGNWDIYPTSADSSTSANLLRLKKMRNTVYAHISSTKLTQADFDIHWTEMENILLGLDPTLTSDIDKYKTEELSQSQYQKYEDYKTQIKQLMENDTSDLLCMFHTLQNLVKEKDAMFGTQLSAIQKSLGQITEDDPTPVLALLKKLPADISQVIIQNLNKSATDIISCVKEEAESVKAHATNEATGIIEALKSHVTAELNAKLPDNHREFLEELKEAMKKDYRQRYRNIPFLPWDETSNIPIDDIYVPLKLESSKDQQVTGKIFKNIEDIFQKYGRQDGNRIIQGKPGAGKSTSCYKLVYDWTKSDSVLADRYELVMLLKARDFKPDQDFFQAITDSIPDYNEANCDKLKQILKNNKIIIVIDGYDELEEKKKQNDLNKLLDNKLYPKCDLVVTTKLCCIDRLKEYHCFDHIFTICPFDDADTKSYVSKFFTCTKNQDRYPVRDFMREVEKKNLHNLVEEPLTCLFLCCVWEENGGKTLPEIWAQIYDHVLNKVMKEKYKLKIGDNWNENKFNTLLDCLSKLAFEKLFQEHSILLFDKDDLNTNYSIDVELACTIGILYKADPPADRKITSKVCDYYMFPHVKFQEFLGARYLYFSPDVNANYAKMDIQDQERFYFVYDFLCGHLSIDTNITEDKLDRLNQMTYLSIKDKFQSRYCSINSDTCTEQWKATGYHKRFKWTVFDNDVITFFKMQGHKEQEFCMEKVHIVEFKSLEKKLPESLRKLVKTNTLKILCLGVVEDEDLGSYLGDVFQANKDLKVVIVTGCGLTANQAIQMTPGLQNLSALSELKLCSNPLGESVVAIIENISESVLNINMLDCKISSEHAKMMAPKLKRLTQLKYFCLHYNPLGSSAVDIIENLQPSIHKLDMRRCDLSADTITSMAPHLQRLPALVTFYVRFNVKEKYYDDIRRCIKGYNSNVRVVLDDDAPDNNYDL